ncbi:hypothetical protein NMY22_g9005 [Coprinellus aureogranulatus]|nr:hypothetical protein NMY22_g9005 [Coprinellus aureogranulatus]
MPVPSSTRQNRRDSTSPQGAPPNIFKWRLSFVDPNAYKGIHGLPAELVLKILKEYKSIALTTEALCRYKPNRKAYVTPPEYSILPSVLRALSQVSQTYRSTFLPMAYESLNACLFPQPGNKITAYHQHVGNTLDRKCAFLLANPDVCPWVRRVNVSLTTWNGGCAVPLFISCLAALPNVQALNILHATECMMKPLRDAFAKNLSISFRSIREVSIAEPCHGFILCLPQMTVLRNPSTKVITSLLKTGYNKVQVLRDTGRLSHVSFKRFVNKAPDLRIAEVPVGTSADVDEYLPCLKRSKKLHTIELRLEKDQMGMSHAIVLNGIKVSREILAASPSKERKYLKVVEIGPSVRMPELGEGDRVYVDVGLE